MAASDTRTTVIHNKFATLLQTRSSLGKRQRGGGLQSFATTWTIVDVFLTQIIPTFTCKWVASLIYNKVFNELMPTLLSEFISAFCISCGLRLGRVMYGASIAQWIHLCLLHIVWPKVQIPSAASMLLGIWLLIELMLPFVFWICHRNSWIWSTMYLGQYYHSKWTIFLGTLAKRLSNC